MNPPTRLEQTVPFGPSGFLHISQDVGADTASEDIQLHICTGKLSNGGSLSLIVSS